MIIITTYALVFLMGIVVGSFLNVCIYRLPKGETVVTTPSHCMHCNKRLHWWELFPLFSWIALGGKCSGCKGKISPQYPIIEAINGVLWVVVFHYYGFEIISLIGMLLSSALLTLTVIDFRTFEIPRPITLFTTVLGVVRVLTDMANYQDYLLGCAVVTGFLYLLFILSGGSAIGGGDVKLMFGCSLILGFQLGVFSFLLACVIGSVIHLIRMGAFGAERRLAMGPYLSMGVYISLLWGQDIVSWYLAQLGL